MRIQSIKIENFKAFESVEICFNDHFNFIIGENNIGKSTLFEAVQLWKLGFDGLIQKNGKSFYGKATPRYLPFENLFFLRTTGVIDIFNNPNKVVSITLTIKYEAITFELKITFEKPVAIDSYLRIKIEGDGFNSFQTKINELGLNLRNSIYIYQTQPVFMSIRNEPFYNNAQLMKKISLGKSHEVLRNKILKGDPSDRKFTRLKERLKAVFSKDINLKFKNKTLQDEEYVRINVQIDNGKEVDISLMGSGTLQVVDIFSTIEFINKRDHCMNILLIDEPDSHIHSNLLSALIDELRNDISNQHFIITHNDRLINKAEEGELLYLSKKSLDIGAIDFLPKSSYSSISVDLSSKLFSLSDAERNKIIIITEGKTDKKILDTAWYKLYPNVDCPYCFISSGIEIEENARNGCAEAVRRSLEMLSTIYSELKLVGLFDNDREGNIQFKGLNKNIFELHNSTITHRKHLTKTIFGMLIPCPETRTDFVTPENITQRYLVIEHLFDDQVLISHGMKGNSILGTDVFEICGNKTTFSNSLDLLDANEFSNFNLLFDKINSFFRVS